jgi:hypothetical protein
MAVASNRLIRSSPELLFEPAKSVTWSIDTSLGIGSTELASTKRHGSSIILLRRKLLVLGDRARQAHRNVPEYTDTSGCYHSGKSLSHAENSTLGRVAQFSSILGRDLEAVPLTMPRAFDSGQDRQ